MAKFKSSIEEYYEHVKDDYDIPFEEFRLICNTPFKFIKNLANNNVLRDFRLKYFGVFKVSDAKVKYYKKNLLQSYKEGNISQKYYEQKIKTIEDYEQSH